MRETWGKRMSEAVNKVDGFAGVVAGIKNEIRNTQVKTVRQVNSNLIMMYFRIGKILFENSLNDSSFIGNVSRELKIEFPDLKGFSRRNLYNMCNFYAEYMDDTAVQQLVAQISWGHNILLLSRIKDKNVREIYIKAVIENGWSRNVLDWQIETNYHKRIGNSSNNFKDVLPSDNSDLINGLVKDPYVFDFLTLREGYAEKELERNMVERIRDVLIELGDGWSFVGNQYKLVVGGEEYFIDMLFYHLKLRCYVVVELKATKYIPEFVGKMNFYLSAVDDLVKSKTDNPTIGLILCKERNKFTANYSLKDINKPIGVSSFKTEGKVIEDALNELPTEDDLNMYLNLGKDKNE